MNKDTVREIVDERLKELGVYPPPITAEELEPPTSRSGFDDEMWALLEGFFVTLRNALADEDKAKLMAARGHYVDITARNNGGVDPSEQQYIRALREALVHISESRARNLLREMCLLLDGGLPSPIRSREDVYGYVEPVEGDPAHEPSHR